MIIPSVQIDHPRLHENDLGDDFLSGRISRIEAVTELQRLGFAWFEAHQWLDNVEEE